MEGILGKQFWIKWLWKSFYCCQLRTLSVFASIRLEFHKIACTKSHLCIQVANAIFFRPLGLDIVSMTIISYVFMDPNVLYYNVVKIFLKEHAHFYAYSETLVLKPFQNKKGQKNLRYPTKKQSFSKVKDCFFVGYLIFIWPFLFWNGFS